MGMGNTLEICKCSTSGLPTLSKLLKVYQQTIAIVRARVVFLCILIENKLFNQDENIG